MRKYHYNSKDLTVKELVKLSDNIGYDTMLNRLRKGWSVEDAVKTPLHAKPSKTTKVDLLETIPKVDTFNGIDLTKQDKVIIVGLISDYLERKERGMELLDKKKTLDKASKVRV